MNKAIFLLLGMLAQVHALSIVMYSAPERISIGGNITGVFKFTPYSAVISWEETVLYPGTNPAPTSPCTIRRSTSDPEGTASILVHLDASAGSGGSLQLKVKANDGIREEYTTWTLALNRRPSLAAGQTTAFQTTEDAGRVVHTLALDDDVTAFPTNAAVTVSVPAGSAIANPQGRITGARTLELSYDTVANRYTGGTPVQMSLTVADSDGDGFATPALLGITVTNTNDPPLVQDTAGAPTLVCDPATAATIAIAGGVALSEVNDPDATRLVSGSDRLGWLVSVADGVDGGDLLIPRARSADWRVQDGAIQRLAGTPAAWTTMAAWTRPGGRSDQVALTMAGTFTQADALATLAQVEYGWLQGVPQTGSVLGQRQIRIQCVEPDGVAGRFSTSPALVRQVGFATANRAPLFTATLPPVPPLGRSRLVCTVSDDDPGLASVTITTAPRAGRFEAHDGRPVASFTLAEAVGAGIFYRNTANDLTTDSASLVLSDHDPDGPLTAAVTLAITIAMPRSGFAVVSDPLLEAEAAAGTSAWPLRFTHAVTVRPVLAAFPGLGAVPAGVSIGGSGPDSWTLVFDWSRVPAAQGFVAFAITAGTAEAASPASASQSMLVRLRTPGASARSTSAPAPAADN